MIAACSVLIAVGGFCLFESAGLVAPFGPALIPGNTRGAIEKSGNCSPLGIYSSGNYCLSNPSNDREAIQKSDNSCPLGWYSSGSYCVKSR